MWPVLASAVAAVTLLAAAQLKLADRTGSSVALATFGLHGGVARRAVDMLAALELALAVGLLAGSEHAGWAAAAMLAVFAVAQLAALAAGRGGAPCGCLGPRSRVGAGGAARAAALSAMCAWLASRGVPPVAGQEPVLAAAAVAVASVTAWRLAPRAPDGALELADEGPALGEPTELAGWLPAATTPVRVAVFTTATCRLCRRLEPALRALAADARVALRTYEQERDREVWAALDVPGAPYAVAVAPDGRVLAKGTVNSAAQLGSVVAAAFERAGTAGPVPRAGSRRDFLARTATAAGGLALGSTVAALVRPGEADAYHFCGHIYTTDGCPHPTGLPRIDSRGRPLRARDGRPVDDLGRTIDGAGRPVHDSGRALVDPDGRPLPRASRTAVCTQVARRFRIRTRVDGAWYRCCGGRVRKLVDCCTTAERRINGDRALKGYCYSGRKVFCVMYYDTRVPC